jgi:hypothetical protein
MDTNTGTVTVTQATFYKDNMQGSTQYTYAINYTQITSYSLPNYLLSIILILLCPVCPSPVLYTYAATLLNMHVCLHHTLLLVLTLDPYSTVM